MIKRVIEQIFQDHAAESLRKTLAEVERAAGGKLHNESLADYVTRLASFTYDAEQRLAALADDRALMDEWHSVSLENGREPDELMGDYMVRIWTSLDVAQRFAEDQKEKLQAANRRIDYLLCEPAYSVQTLRDLEATANDNGRKPDEAVREFMTRTVAELTHAQTAIRMIQNRAYIYNCKKDEPVIDFLSRMNGTLNELRQRVRECDDAAEKAGCGRTEETAEFIARLAADLKELKQTITEKNATISKLRGTHADDIARIDKLSAQLAEIEAEATECGRDEGETVPRFMSRMVIDLGDERASSMAMSKAWAESKEDVARERERGNRINSEYEASIANIMAAANKLGRADYEAPDAFMQRQASEIERLRSRVSEEINDAYKCAGTLGRLSTETVTDFMKRQHKEIEKEQQRNVQMGERLRLVMQDYQDKSQQLLKVQGWHEENLQKIRELTNKHTVKTLAEIFDTAKKHGRRSDETVSQFIIRQEARRKDAGDDSFMEHAYKVADGIGRLEDETLAEFITRQHDALQSAVKERAQLKKDMAAEVAQLLEVARSNDQYAKEADDISAANGRTERESLGWFVDRICAESKRKDQTVARLQKVLTKIHDAAKSGGLKQGEKIGAFIERMNEDLYKVRCDAASESMKMGNANKRLQHAYDEADEERKVSKRFHALAVEERNNAQEEVSRLSSELDSTTKRLQAGEFTWNTYGQLCNFATSCGMTGDESVKQFIERKIIEASTVTADRDRIRAELASILSEANKSGRCNGDPVQLLKAGQSDLDARLSAEREAEDIKKRLRSLNEHAALKGMRGDETTAEFITRQHRLAADRQTALDRASETIATLTSDLTSAIVDKALAGNGAKEINRLSALVADLQVELDDAKGKYGGIMAQLGNETPLQLIERMQRLAHDQRASTIPHDERAMLVAEIADLRKRLEAKTADHARVDYYIGCVRLCASNHGLRKGEELKFFINSKCNELAEALKTVESQSIAITEAHRVTEQYTAAVEALAKLKNWASTIRHKVLVAMVHTKAMAEYDTIMKELDGGKVPQ